jgi:aryl-alcohol dehydrogenase-like predicted oxidoreductase
LIKKVARSKNATPAQIALAWLLAQKPWIVPITGTTKLERLLENIGLAALELTANELLEIVTTASNVNVQGVRYTGACAKMVGR